jgi:hypothetical protein
MTGSPGTPPASGRTVGLALALSGIVTLVVGVVLGATVEPFLYAIAAISIVDFALAWAFATDRLGPGAARRRAATAGEAAVAAEAAAADPSYTPYAREA